jgi:hypothetical protein
VAAVAAVELYWLPLGADGRVVRVNGWLYEALSAWRERRPRCQLYHAALQVHLPDARFTVELTPVPDAGGAARGVVVQGPVGSRLLGRWRWFRYELRCWRDGTIPDLRHAVGGSQVLTTDAEVARALLSAAPSVPALVWGRDELRAGEMWNSNSVISCLLAHAGVIERVRFPPGGRAPGWAAGPVAAVRYPVAGG